MDQNLNTTTTENIARFLTSIGYTSVPIRQNIAGQLLIHAKINDIEGVYILDTGAGTTVIDSKLADLLRLKLSHEETEQSGGGVGSHGIDNVPSYYNTIEINNFKMDNLAVAVMSLESAWASLASIGARDELSGFIGVDVLKSGSAIMEFSTMTLYLKQP